MVAAATAGMKVQTHRAHLASGDHRDNRTPEHPDVPARWWGFSSGLAGASAGMAQVKIQVFPTGRCLHQKTLPGFPLSKRGRGWVMVKHTLKIDFKTLNNHGFYSSLSWPS